MGTRSLTVMQDNDGKEIAVLYRQMDGYPSGHGQELVNFLNPFDIVNGLSVAKPKRQVANGLECLAAQIVAHFKTDAGGFYLYPAGTRDCGQDYVYIIKPAKTQNGTCLKLEIRDGGNACLFDGALRTFNAAKIEGKD